MLNASEGWPVTTDADVPLNDESIAGAPAPPPPPIEEEQGWHFPKGSGWEQRFFDKPLSAYNFPKSHVRLPDGSGIPLKAPGKFPGIEFGVEMHSFQALQSVVPPEGLPKSLSSQQDQSFLLAPSHSSPDYNGGFLRFTW